MLFGHRFFNSIPVNRSRGRKNQALYLIFSAGFDNIKRGVVCPVPLTTVDQRPEEIAVRAIGMVMNKINGIETENRIILKPKLIIRNSCGVRSLNRVFETES